MWKLFMVIALSAFASAIKVPVANLENTDLTYLENNKPIYVPTIQEPLHQILKSEDVEAPATFLLPPTDEALMYYKPQESDSNWYPIAPTTQITKSPERENLRTAKSQRDALPATMLLPPLENALNFYFADPLKPVAKLKQPTILYPKKFVGYKPVPIPIAQFAENLTEVPRAKPLKPLTPYPSIDGIYITPMDEKKQFLYAQTEEKRKLKKEQEVSQDIVPEENAQYNGDIVTPAEQQASESNHDYPEQESYPAKQTVKRPVYVPANKGERTEFRMHGMNGPHSYQFGYDTGKGKNRQFRYEERDNDGHVRGHYGYMDKGGKLRVVKYDADPKLGFRADPPVVQE
ncbi:uncharacterized protein LOC123707482 [Pieris brassicae]|uniref:Cuticle protein n=1 Tax=Pieris brassicae TaxID=7116 RepID=A0A9P0X906_PIEBR|nr:uncharacterized protein LOC123707482 [Pieris brassicae]CAH4019418.1 unnamed protein product [Pieris brassicae]